VEPREEEEEEEEEEDLTAPSILKYDIECVN
jgi:hypothetical protein